MARTIAARALLVALGLAIPALLLEIMLRLFGPVIPGNYETGVWAEGHPVVGHFHIPGAAAWVHEPEFTTYLRFNQFGLRGPEIARRRRRPGRDAFCCSATRSSRRNRWASRTRCQTA